MKKATATKKKEVKPVDEADLNEVISEIVNSLIGIDSFREDINERVKYLKDTYGLNASHVRAAATLLKKDGAPELTEKTNSILSIIEMCK